MLSPETSELYLIIGSTTMIVFYAVFLASSFFRDMRYDALELFFAAAVCLVAGFVWFASIPIALMGIVGVLLSELIKKK